MVDVGLHACGNALRRNNTWSQKHACRALTANAYARMWNLRLDSNDGLDTYFAVPFITTTWF